MLISGYDPVEEARTLVHLCSRIRNARKLSPEALAYYQMALIPLINDAYAAGGHISMTVSDRVGYHSPEKADVDEVVEKHAGMYEHAIKQACEEGQLYPFAKWCESFFLDLKKAYLAAGCSEKKGYTETVTKTLEVLRAN